MRLGGIAALGLIAAPLPLPASLHVALSATRAGATNVRVQLTERAELQCGRPTPGTITVTLPTAMGVPATLARGAVRLNGAAVAAHITGHRVSFVVPPPTGVICDVIGPGSFTVTLTSGAHLRNPSSAGSYRYSLTYNRRTITGAARVTT
jgi:uncharacterized protein (DUF58 family)